MIRFQINRIAVLIFTVTSLFNLGSLQHVVASDHDTNARGKAAYIEMSCHECHGYQGQGGGNGPKLAPSMLAFDAFAHIVHKPYGAMPAYPVAHLSNEKLKLIHDYLLSMPPPPDPDTISILSVE